MSDEKHPKLHAALTDALDKVTKVGTWGNKGHEFKVLKELEEKLISLTASEDEAIDAGIGMLRLFYQKRRANEFGFDHPFTPRGWKAVWDRLNSAVDTGPPPPVAAGDPVCQDMLRSIQLMYTRSYTDQMAVAIAKLCGKMTREYMIQIHDEVVKNFTPTSTRPLPDVASFNLARAAIGPPVEYQKALPEPQIPESERKKNQRTVREMIVAMSQKTGVRNEEELARVEEQIRKGNATEEKEHWAWCMRHNNGVWIRPELRPTEAVPSSTDAKAE